MQIEGHDDDSPTPAEELEDVFDELLEEEDSDPFSRGTGRQLRPEEIPTAPTYTGSSATDSSAGTFDRDSTTTNATFTLPYSVTRTRANADDDDEPDWRASAANQ